MNIKPVGINNKSLEINNKILEIPKTLIGKNNYLFLLCKYINLW